MNLNRRKFIRNSSLGLIGLGVSNSLFSNVFNFTPNTAFKPSQTILQMLTTASVKRKQGLLIEATAIYNQILAIDSAEIRAYDGKRKILLQERYKELEVLNLYIGAYTLHPTNLKLKERIAKEYMRLALGNKKFKNQLLQDVNEDVLQKAKTYLEQIKIEIPTDEQVEEQLQKAYRKIQQNADSEDARTNQLVKDYKRQKQIDYNQRFDILTTAELKEKLDALLTKTSDDYRDVHIRELYREYIKKLKQDGSYDLAANYTKELYLFDKKDTTSLRIARSTCKKDQKYDVLEAIERKNDSIKKSFWSKIALFDVLHNRYKKEGVGSLTEMNNILVIANSKKYTFYHIFEYKVREIKLAMLRNNLIQAQTLLNNFADTLICTKSAHFIDKFNLLCASYYLKMDNRKYAMTVFDIAMNQNDTVLSDEFLKKLVLVNRDKDYEKKIHMERLIKQREKLLNS